MSKSFFDLGIPEHLPIRDVVLIPKMARANKNLALTDNFMILQVFKNQSNLLNIGI